MVGLVVMLALVVALAMLLWWTVGLPRTRPRPDSRYRGRTYMSVHRQLRRRRPPR